MLKSRLGSLAAAPLGDTAAATVARLFDHKLGSGLPVVTTPRQAAPESEVFQ